MTKNTGSGEKNPEKAGKNTNKEPYKREDLLAPFENDSNMPPVLKVRIDNTEPFLAEIASGLYDNLTKQDWLNPEFFWGWPPLHYAFSRVQPHQNASFFQYLDRLGLSDDEWFTRPAANVPSLFEQAFDMALRAVLDDKFNASYALVPWHLLEKQSLEFWVSPVSFENPLQSRLVSFVSVAPKIMMKLRYQNWGQFGTPATPAALRAVAFFNQAVAAIPEKAWLTTLGTGQTARARFLKDVYDLPTKEYWGLMQDEWITSIPKDELLRPVASGPTARMPIILLQQITEGLLRGSYSFIRDDDSHCRRVLKYLFEDVITPEDLKEYPKFAAAILKSPINLVPEGRAFLKSFRADFLTSTLNLRPYSGTVFEYLIQHNLLEFLDPREVYKIGSDIWLQHLFVHGKGSAFSSAMLGSMNNFNKVPAKIFLALDYQEWMKHETLHSQRSCRAEVFMQNPENAVEKVVKIMNIYMTYRQREKLHDFYKALHDVNFFLKYPKLEAQFLKLFLLFGINNSNLKPS